MRFKGVIFDMGDILYDASVWRRWLTEVLQQYGVKITYPELVAQWEALLVDVYRGQAEYWERFGELLRVLGVPEDRRPTIREAARQKGHDVQRNRRPMEGAADTLATLQAVGVKLAVLSDNESGSGKVRGILDQLGLGTYFDAVITSADIGQVKPHPAAFNAAVAALEVEVDDCAFVGHDVDELEGARRVGLYAIAYNEHPDAPADVRLEHFRQLGKVVLNGRQ